jgi:TetR/AcrR family transcriptional regulator, transcriptional repressor of aconitase
MPKVSKQYRDARREAILTAARRCFQRDGFHATSMQDLFIEAGLSAGAMYRYFESKDELIIAIVEDNMRDVVAMMHTIATDRRDISLGTAMADVIQLLSDQHDANGFGGLAVQVWAEALRNPSVAEQYNDLLFNLRAELMEVVRQHQAPSAVSTDVSAAAVATVLIATTTGLILQLAMLGPQALVEVPDALRALWPQ